MEARSGKKWKPFGSSDYLSDLLLASYLACLTSMATAATSSERAVVVVVVVRIALQRERVAAAFRASLASVSAVAVASLRANWKQPG